MTKEYYTPRIEDFYVGFEFVLWLNNSYWSKPRVWDYKTTDSLKQIEQDINNQQVKVKYLDKEDIESLGFRRDMIKNTLVNNFIFYKDNISLSFDNQINDLKISVLTKSKRTCDLFVGHIKNISELKVLLKQLEIENVINATK